MNIWLINQYAVPPTQPGITRHYMLARELIQLGHQVTILASSFDHVTRTEARLQPHEQSRLESIADVPFMWLRTPPYPGNTIARIWNMIMFAMQVWHHRSAPVLGRPDVVVGSSPHLFAALAAQLVAATYRVPFVLEVRDLWPQSLVDLANVPEKHPIVLALKVLERYLYMKADYIVTPLPRAHEHFIRHGAKPDRILWLPNGIDASAIPMPSKPERPTDRPFTVMYAGAHGLANGLDTVLEAAALLQAEGWGDRVRFRLVGDGPEKPRLKAMAEERGLMAVTFDDPVPKEQIYRVLQEADAFSMNLKDSPVFKWGVSPNKLFDYLSSGRPVIYGVNTPYDPVAEVQAGVSIPSSDPQALARAVKELAETPVDLRHEMGMRGHSYVAERYDLKHLALELEVVIQSVKQTDESRGASASPSHS